MHQNTSPKFQHPNILFRFDSPSERLLSLSELMLSDVLFFLSLFLRAALLQSVYLKESKMSQTLGILGFTVPDPADPYQKRQCRVDS